MQELAHWHEVNERYLAAALTWLRLILRGSSAAERTEAATTMDRAEATEPPPAGVLLARMFGLSRFEQQVLLLCAAMEFDTRMPALCAHAQDDPARPYPTFALALGRLDEPAWDALAPDRPLRHWRLIEVDPTGPRPLTASPLRADERIVNFLKGLNHLDARLAPVLTPLESPDPPDDLSRTQQAAAEAIAARLRSEADAGRLPPVYLLGPDATGKRALVRRIAAGLGLHAYRLPAEMLPASADDLDELARLWRRECLLLPVALYLDAEALDTAEVQAAPVGRFLGRVEGPVFVAAADLRPDLDPERIAVTVEVARPDPLEQREAWSAALGPAVTEAPALLAGQFDLDLATIRRIARARPDRPAPPERLWDACRAETRPRLDALARRLDPRAGWDDLVLPAAELDALRRIAGQVRRRGTVYDAWGFRRRTSRGLGIAALFAGESGTGKTLAAEVLARDLRLDLYRIDLAGVVSKYIGETEKNLRRLFDAAERGGAILFFDEADALFGKRSEVKDSHDRYANIEINYLLQRMESYRGLAILATNMKAALDPAFLRRLRFVISFPFPGPAERAAIWRRAFPAETPTAGLDFDWLARFHLTGGGIQNAALGAAFLAAEAGTPVTMPLVLDAARVELRKGERPINESDFRWHPPGGVIA